MAPGDRRGRGGSKIGRGAGRGATAGAEDVNMRDAIEAGGPQRRTRSSASASVRGTGRTSAPYSAPGRRVVGGSPLADRVRGINKPTVLKDGASKGAVEVLKQLVQSRWNAETGLLNLENLASDPILINAKIKPPGHKAAPKNAAPALWKLASENCPNIQSISLAKNNLTTLVDMAPAALIRYLPKVKNLSLADNALSAFADLNPLSTVVGAITGSKPGLGELTELILIGNPLQVRETNKSASDYSNEIRRRFPSLTILDFTPVDQKLPVPKVDPHASKALAHVKPPLSIVGRADRQKTHTPTQPLKQVYTVEAPLNIQPAFKDSDASGNAMSQFLVKFFAVFDNDRQQLRMAYTAMATFSICVNTTVPDRARKLHHLPADVVAKQRGLSWATYLGSSYDSTSKDKNQQEENLSRNFLRMKSAHRRETTLHVGPDNIMRISAKLPKTSHPLDDPAKFLVDTWQQPGTSPEYPDTLFVSVHGEFAEHPSLAVRSFDRVFLLAPTPPGTPAAAAGWPCVILSDMLMVRNWTSPEFMRPASSENPAVGQPNGAIPPLEPAQQDMMSQLHQATGLNAQFCLQCLVETQWNYQAALQAFQNARSSIPQEAFI